ncbi:hypothetical protein E4U50_006448 [Claviceps purpurea]|nr:hypothetical protein E4U50_006448 [Claviceps purpurea]
MARTLLTPKQQARRPFTQREFSKYPLDGDVPMLDDLNAVFNERLAKKTATMYDDLTIENTGSRSSNDQSVDSVFHSNRNNANDRLFLKIPSNASSQLNRYSLHELQSRSRRSEDAINEDMPSKEGNTRSLF